MHDPVSDDEMAMVLRGALEAVAPAGLTEAQLTTIANEHRQNRIAGAVAELAAQGVVQMGIQDGETYLRRRPDPVPPDWRTK